MFATLSASSLVFSSFFLAFFSRRDLTGWIMALRVFFIRAVLDFGFRTV